MIKTEQFVIRTIEENDVEFLHSMNSQEFRGDFEEFRFESKYSLTTQYHKDGFCSDTFQMLVVESLDKKPLGLIYLNFKKVLEGAGFVKEGVLRNYRYHHGKYHDSFIYSIIK